MEYVGQKTFVLDERTSVMVEYLQYINDSANNILSFINYPTNTVYMYDYDNGLLLDTIRYDKEGNNGVGEVQGYCFLNRDSIFVYQYGNPVVHLTNGQGEILWSKALFENFERKERVMYPEPYLMTNNPMKYADGKLILNGFISGETSHETKENRPVTMLYKIDDASLKFLNPYPMQYVEYNWGGGFTHRLPYTDLDNKGNLLISFPADHNLWRCNVINHQTDSLYAGSEMIEYTEPYAASKEEVAIIDEYRVFEWYMTTPSYEGIFYDKYRDLYYRIARLPDTNYKLGNRGNNKPVIIIVLDSRLHYLGEEILPPAKEGNYRINNCFVSKDGLNIQVLTDDEDKLIFEQYKVVVN
ncbi:DUF4221 family protein [uncultured Bacteroides sp.]|uniref:DUF4221 family protein n=1 Tax=uncultured Bacteroides sp. TaxID=162156 RepID=UPI0025F02F1F|nr:DUF4221 family protein [uncultured Bacteroides sp.]